MAQSRTIFAMPAALDGPAEGFCRMASSRSTGGFLGPVIELPRLNEQAVVLLDHM